MDVLFAQSFIALPSCSLHWLHNIQLLSERLTAGESLLHLMNPNATKIQSN